jgi:hypothetical protein
MQLMDVRLSSFWLRQFASFNALLLKIIQGHWICFNPINLLM